MVFVSMCGSNALCAYGSGANVNAIIENFEMINNSFYGQQKYCLTVDDKMNSPEFGNQRARRLHFFPFSVKVSTTPFDSRSRRIDIVYQGTEPLNAGMDFRI